jgi:superoxide reductase
MAKKVNEIYKCDICGNIVEILHSGVGEIICCNEPMKLLVAGEIDAAREKHVPVIEKEADGYRVKVGSVAHPMEEKHFIEFIELLTGDGRICRQALTPGAAPEAFFAIDADQVTAREYCNIHGLWKASN